MSTDGQFCSVARALDVLGGRWTLLVVREILCGSRRFNDIRRGIPRISRTVLSERLRALTEAGAVARSEGRHGPEYGLTEAGLELANVVAALGHWGQRWLPREPIDEDLDLEPVLVDMRRRVRFDALPKEPVVIRFEIRGHPPVFMLLRFAEASVCTHNPGFPEALTLRGPLGALVAWWRGDSGFLEAQRMGLSLEGTRTMARAFPHWFERYLFADVAAARDPAQRSAEAQPGAASRRAGPG